MEFIVTTASIILVFLGLYCLFITHGVPLRPGMVIFHFKNAMFPQKRVKGKLSSYTTLATALGGSIGTGNIVGVASAIIMGGPGAVFWMWVSGILGMCIKYVEVYLAVKYRRKQGGEYLGGAMHCIETGMGGRFKPLARLFAFAAICASFAGGGIVQMNAVVASVSGDMFTSSIIVGIAISAAVALALFGGTSRIFSCAWAIVPAISVFYIGATLYLIISNISNLPSAICSIFTSAFGVKELGAGVAGYSIGKAVRYGMARGIFSNEAGIGSSPMAHSCTEDATPARQAMVGVMEVFIDTIIICSLTAFSILCAGIDIPNGDGAVSGMSIVRNAFCTVLPHNVVTVFLSISITAFAYTSMLGWSLYGKQAYRYLSGRDSTVIYNSAYIIISFLGVFFVSETAWQIGELCNFAMALSNIVMLLSLSDNVYYGTRTELCYNKIKYRSFLR